MSRPRKFGPAFKAKVAVEALQEKEPLAVLAKKHGVAPSVITGWKEELYCYVFLKMFILNGICLFRGKED